MTTTRKLAIAVWSAAILATGVWWPLSYRYSGGFTASVPVTRPLGPPVTLPPGWMRFTNPRPIDRGIAAISGRGKVIVYLSWRSRFTRKGAFFEPVIPHEFPHPWFGFQNEGGRLWISLPVGLISVLVSAGAFFHLRSSRSSPKAPTEPTDNAP